MLFQKYNLSLIISVKSTGASREGVNVLGLAPPYCHVVPPATSAPILRHLTALVPQNTTFVPSSYTSVLLKENHVRRIQQYARCIRQGTRGIQRPGNCGPEIDETEIRGILRMPHSLSRVHANSSIRILSKLNILSLPTLYQQLTASSSYYLVSGVL